MVIDGARAHSTAKKRIRLSNTDEENSDGGNGAEPSRARKGKQKEVQVLFACPYIKRFGPKGRCLNKGFPTTARVKAHLYRCHRQAPHCPRCFATFSNEDKLISHFRVLPPCENRNAPRVEGFDQSQEIRLKSRAGLCKLPEYEKWSKIYHILFPEVTEDPIPSPYYEPVSDPSGDISKFLHQNLPSLVKEALERRLAAIGHDTSREDMVEIVHQAQREVYRDINQSYASRSPGSQAALAEVANNASPHRDDYSQRSPEISGYEDSTESLLSDDYWWNLMFGGELSMLPQCKNANGVDADNSKPTCDSGYGAHPSSWIPKPVWSHSREEAGRNEPSNSYTKVDADDFTPVNHKLPGLRQRREDDAPSTDLGHDSVPGLRRHFMHEKQHDNSNHVELRDPYATSDLVGSDAGTSYSDSSATLPKVTADKFIIDIINNINQRLDSLCDMRTLVSASKRLPALIKAFAVKLGSDKPDRLNLRAMRSIHKHHQYIASHLRIKLHRDDSDAMPLSEIMTLWGNTQDKDLETVDPSEYFQGVEDELDATDDEDVVSGESVANEESDNAFSDHGKTIVRSAAYEWLISSLVNEVSFNRDEAQTRTMVDQISQGILSQLPTGRISSRRPPDRHTVSFKIPKSSLPFLSEDQRTRPAADPPMMIGDRIAITSASAFSVQVSKVSQYMDQTWPLGGRTLLSVLQNVINEPGPAWASSVKEGNCEIEIVIEGFYIEVFVTGTPYSIAEYGEQLAWLTAALQPSVSDLAMYVRPFIRRVENHTPIRGNIHSWVIEVWREEIDDADMTARAVQEWQGESKSPVIVRGFPTMSRPKDCHGIEVPSQLPASLLPSPLRDRGGTRLLLKATGKVLQLFNHIKGVTVWHILNSPKEICACRLRLWKDNGKYHLPCLDIVELQRHRHIITECSVAEMHDRDIVSRMDLGLGSTGILQPECSPSEAAQLTSYSDNAIDSSDSLDVDMLSIPDSSEYGVGGPPDTDDAALAIIEEVASRLVYEYGQYTEQHNLGNESPSNTKQCSPGGQQSNTTHDGSQSTLLPITTQNTSISSLRKRSAEWDEGEDDGDLQHRPPQKKQRNSSSGKGRRNFACPFWKNDPNRHDNCFGKKLDMVSRVKQHLARTHYPPFYCDSCLVIFPDLECKRTHLRDERSQCKYDQTARLNGITYEQRIQLSRKPKKGLSDKEQWFAVWDIIFPDLRRPLSPYLDDGLSREMNNFREFSESHGSAIVADVLRREHIVAPGVSEDVLRKAVKCANVALIARWRGFRGGIFQRSKSDGSSSADASSSQQYNGLPRVQLSSLAGQNSTTDSGVVVESHSSARGAREDTNLSPCDPMPQNLPSDGRDDVRSYETAGVEDHVAGPFDNGADHSQLFVSPALLDAKNPDRLIQCGLDRPDPGQLNLDDFVVQLLAENGYELYANNGNATAEDGDLDSS